MPQITLQRRNTRNTRENDIRAHQNAAAGAVQAQKTHSRANSPHQRKPEKNTTTHRNDTIKLTTFKPGFEQETEEQLAQAFKRPVRKFKEDPPFYPWLPLTPLYNLT